MSLSVGCSADFRVVVEVKEPLESHPTGEEYVALHLVVLIHRERERSIPGVSVCWRETGTFVLSSVPHSTVMRVAESHAYTNAAMHKPMPTAMARFVTT